MLNLYENFHKKRINEVLAEGPVLYSCSNDGSVVLFDLNANRLIKKFQTNSELYSLCKNQSSLVCGSESKIYFW